MRLIDADELVYSRVRIAHEDGTIGGYNAVVMSLEIKEAPTVDAVPVKHGCWIKNDNRTYACSECQSWIPNEQHYYARYCLHCGARMDKDEK